MTNSTRETTDRPTWVPDAIFYEIFPERFANGDPHNDPPEIEPWGGTPTRENFFGGDLQGILDHLDYLEALGITALYLTPFFTAQTNHRYDISDYLSVDPHAGDLDVLRKLVQAAHTRGIRVLFDCVFNHCGAGFPPFVELQEKGAASAYQDWFFVDTYPLHAAPPTYQTCGGASYLPKLNTANPEVRDYLLKAATYWLREVDMDGWRLDVPWKVPRSFWQEFRTTVKNVKPDAYIVGEIWRDGTEWIQGDTCDGIMNYRLRNHILDYCVWDHMDAEDFDFELRQLAAAYGTTLPYQMNLLGSHDTPRILTLCENNAARLSLALTFQFTYTGTPLIYYGDEIGMRGGNDPHCRGTMIWEQTAWNTKILETYRQLIHIRRQHPALRRGKFKVLKIFNAVYAYLRYTEDDAVLVVLNPRAARENFHVPLGDSPTTGHHWHDLLSDEDYTVAQGELLLPHLGAETAMILVPAAA